MIDFDKSLTQDEYLNNLQALLMGDENYPDKGYKLFYLKERIDDLLYKEKKLKELFNKNHTFINIIKLLNRNLKLMNDMGISLNGILTDNQRSKLAGYKQAIIDICEYLDDNTKRE